jgi:eukaryotic-like serine/threonine-protein kinase
MDEPQVEALETREPKPENQFSRWSSMILMIAILTVAGLVSALTSMRFAIRGKEVEVPKLVGKTKEEAEQILRNGGLKLRITSSRFSSDIAEGKVLEQHPAAGTRLKADRTVKVLISLGEQRFAVPNLVGTSLRAAQLTLAQRRFMLGNTVYTHTDDGESSTVVYQSPKPGTQEGTDPSVDIVISLGPPAQYFIMPDLIGKPAELVSGRVRTEGFHLGKVNYRKYPGVEPGVVIFQKPQAGYRLTKPDVIFLDVSQ